MAMANGATTKAARRAAREAVVAAQADLVRRNRANMDDLAVFCRLANALMPSTTG